jgi:cytochrome bd-type quinol oxidase subunit 2
LIKRTAELVLGIIGVAFNALGAILVGVFIGATGDFIAEDIRNDPEFTAEEADIVSNLFGGIGWYYVIVSAIAAILGVVALVLLRRNNKSTVSGVIFIVTAVLSALLTIFVATVPAILYLVAGILAIVRKPIDTNDNTIESY